MEVRAVAAWWQRWFVTAFRRQYYGTADADGASRPPPHHLPESTASLLHQLPCVHACL